MIRLIRHGEAAAGWGQADDPGLSPLGHRQAEAVGQALMEEPATTLFTSPMARCQETSLPFARLSGLSPGIETAVSEIPTPDGLEDRVAWLRGFMAGNWQEAPELLTDWRATLLDTVRALPAETVVFTHFIAINTIVGALNGSDDVTSFRPGHCSVTRIRRRKDGLELESLGSEAATRVL